LTKVMMRALAKKKKSANRTGFFSRNRFRANGLAKNKPDQQFLLPTKRCGIRHAQS
jgi:hypothetical protein